MPFTPFHMGPGILIKALLQGSFSLMIFGWAQILMDIQPLIVLLTGQGHLHGFSHTYLGGLIIAVAAVLSGKYFSEIGLIILGIANKAAPIKISYRVASISAFIGTFSHILLDSMMHSDIEPFFPFTSDNHLLGIITLRTLHQACLYSGLLGASLYYLVQLFNKFKTKT